MSRHRIIRQVFAWTLVSLLLLACSVLQAGPTPTPTVPPGPRPGHWESSPYYGSFKVTTDGNIHEFRIMFPSDHYICRDGIAIDENGVFTVTLPSIQEENYVTGEFDTDTGTNLAGTFSILPSTGAWKAEWKRESTPVLPDSGGGRIAFLVTSWDEDTVDIYAMEADGSGITNLTNGQTGWEGGNWELEWSPDGERIAFCSETYGIGVVNTDGSGLVYLTSAQGHYHSPVWSPDSERIAFGYSGEDERRDGIYVVNADGTGQASNLIGGPGIYSLLSWSPDGGSIAFALHHSGKQAGLYVMNADGSGSVQLTDKVPERTYNRIAWSPDSSKLAFDVPLGGVYLVNADGSGLTTLADGSSPVWSPDGEKIIFISGDIFFMAKISSINIDGSGLTDLTGDTWGELEFSVSPTGEWIVFSADDGWSSDIYVVDIDGSEIVNLTNTCGTEESYPIWQP